MDPRIKDAVVFLVEHCELPISLEALARQSGLSAPRFSHLFHQETGTSPGKMIKAVRMRKARELLKDTRCSVKEVMTQVGVSDKNHFRRDFKSAFGVTPTEFRRRIARCTEETGDTVAGMAYK
jgi:transcriptional regulator GlxA family with amidase domain